MRASKLTNIIRETSSLFALQLTATATDERKSDASDLVASPENFAKRNKSDDKEEVLTAMIVDVTRDPGGIDY